MNTDIFTQRIQSVLFQLMAQLTARMQASGSLDGQNQAFNGSSPLTGPGGQGDFSSLIQQASAKYGVNPNLVDAVIRAESNYDPDAVSHAGAMGLMQLMPGTARGLGVDNPMNPVENIEGGVKLLSQLLDRYDGDVRLTLAAYNAGPGAVDRYDGIPPYRETQVYVQRVLGYYGSAPTSGSLWSA